MVELSEACKVDITPSIMPGHGQYILLIISRLGWNMDLEGVHVEWVPLVTVVKAGNCYNSHSTD